MTTYESPLSPAQSSIIDEYDDESHKCRRCDLAILEGHAYELGGDRWHMYCFSCSKCSKLLGTSSNFLVLGTGDLICSDCSYACNACGKKIDDLAILTGDQAYCSSCFCCRNCKKRIEDLKYARTSKGLFCMSCHEKLLEKKRRHDNEKRLKQRQSRIPNPEKSLPKVPEDYKPRNSEDYLRAMSPAETVSSGASTPAIEVASVSTKVGISEVPPRSPERVATHPSPRYPSDNNLDTNISLDPPVAVSPMRFPAHLSPMVNTDEFYSSKENEDHLGSTQSTPKSTYLGIETPDRLQARSPLRQTILTPNGKNRQAVVLGDVSSSSSNNILSNYINESPPPRIPPPKIPDEDFIDMGDSDEDTKYTRKPSGFNEIRHSDSVPKGLNIEGLPSFDEHFDQAVQQEQQQQEQQRASPQPEQPDEPKHRLSPDSYKDAVDYNNRSTHQRSYSAEHNEFDGPGSAKSWKNVLMSPNGNTSPLKRDTTTATTPSQLQKSRSIRSPKNFLNFRKHKKSISQTSVENYKISSPLMETKDEFEAIAPQFSFQTPKLAQDGSPYQGAALFTTPPVPVPESEHLTSSARKLSMHGRSRSDANVETHDLAQSELELRSLRIEIRDLKVTKHGVLREVNELNSQKDEMKVELLQLQTQINQLKLQLQGQSSKSSLDDIDETNPYVSSSSHQHGLPHISPPQLQSQPQSAQSAQSAQSSQGTGTASSTPTVAVAEQVHVDPKQKTTKTRFWRRFGPKTDGMSVSQSAYSLSQLLNDGGASATNGGHSNRAGGGGGGVAASGNLQISAPMLRTDETDELGGNDNKKLMSTKGLTLENGNSSGNSVATDGSTSALIMSDLFNSSLEMRTVYEKRPIPLIVSRLVSEVEKRGLDSEGLYRKNGATSQMNSILKSFNSLLQAETSHELENALNNCDVNAVTSSLKRYMYFHLPEPVITMHVYEQFIGVAKLIDDDDKIDSLAYMITQMPKANARVLIYLLTHLKRVESYSHLNKMTFHNLAVVFAPTFSRVSDGERELMDMAPRNTVTEFMLVRQDDIFDRVKSIE